MVALLLAGCGGGGGSVAKGEISGVVFDGDGKPVKGATVYVDAGGHRSTETDSGGTYVLRDVAAKDIIVRAETPDGNYLGQNLSRVFSNERDMSVNITLYPSTSLARVIGQVTNASGHVQQGLRVFARPTDGSILSSSSAMTDADGFFTIDRLVQGIEYRIVANAPGKGEDSRLLTFSTRETHQNLVLGTASDPVLAAPTNLDAIAYTTPGQDTFRTASVTTVQASRAMEAIKQQIDPTRAARIAKRPASRDTSLGRPIEVDLFWDEYGIVDTYGFGIYRHEVPSAGLPPPDTSMFLHDPLASYYADGDAILLPGVEYSYGVSAISSSFDEATGEGESAISDRITVTPLGDLLLAPSSGQTVAWSTVTGAAKYKVYVYSSYPDVGILPVETSGDLSGAATSYTISASLTSGHRYYYVVVGTRSENSANALSIVDSFVK